MSSDKSIVPHKSKESDSGGILKEVPAPMSVFTSRVVNPDNALIDEAALDRALLDRQQVRDYRQQMKQARRELEQRGYADLRNQIEALRLEYAAAENGQRAAILQAAQETAQELKALAPLYRQYTEAKLALENHRAAVEREKVHRKLTLEMSKEARIHAKTIQMAWSRLGYQHTYTVKNKVRHDRVKFSSCVVTPDNIQLRIHVSQLGLFGGSVPTLPYGVRVLDITHEDTLRELSVACQRQVTADISNPAAGAWVIVNRLGTTDGLLDRVHFRQVLYYYPESEKDYLPLTIGVGYGREIQWVHLTKYPHVLIGGATGGGKSNLVTSIICTLLMKYSPDEMRLVLVDLKEGMEFGNFASVPHLLRPVILQNDALIETLSVLETYRKERANKFAAVMARDIIEYNRRCPDDRQARIVIIIDEYASIQSDRKDAAAIQNLIMQLLNKGRATGIHIILCTQNPSVDIIPGASKANMSLRVAFQMPTKSASQTILGTGDAADLPDVRGRAMCMVGSKKWKVQVGLVHDSDIQQALDVANAYPPAREIVLPQPTVASAGFTEEDLIKVVIEYMGGNMGYRPIYDFIKGDEDITREQLSNMVARIIEKQSIEYNGQIYTVKRKGSGYRLEILES